jgi:hypothetical protein
MRGRARGAWRGPGADRNEHRDTGCPISTPSAPANQQILADRIEAEHDGRRWQVPTSEAATAAKVLGLTRDEGPGR